MRTADLSFLGLCTADVMSRQVKVIPQDMPLPAAARILSEARISGAPVVDADGRCLGVLSAIDFVHWARHGAEADQVRAAPRSCFCSDWQVVNVNVLPGDEVPRHMTPGPVTVLPTTPITEVARIMSEAHIHRVIVADMKGRPIGIVTSTDILAAIAKLDDVRGTRCAYAATALPGD